MIIVVLRDSVPHMALPLSAGIMDHEECWWNPSKAFVLISVFLNSLLVMINNTHSLLSIA